MRTVTAAVGAAVRRLAQLAHRGGTWTDFWLEPGPSSSWVTAYAGLVMAHAETTTGSTTTSARSRAGPPAGRRTRSWRPHATRRGDGRRPSAPTPTPRLGPSGCCARRAGRSTSTRGRSSTSTTAPAGYAPTPARPRPVAGPTPCPRSPRLCSWPGSRVPGSLATSSRHDGSRTSPPTAAGRASGGPGRRTRPRSCCPPGSLAGRPAGPDPAAPATGDPADLVRIAAALGLPTTLDPLLSSALPDGQWPGSTVLLVPAAHPGQAPTRTTDARGAFSTATALDALLATRPWPSGSGRRPVARGRDERWDPVVADAATGQGVDPAAALAAFRSLTRESLAAPSPWPAEQLSSLAAGLPVELSAQLAVHPDPVLRLACEVGDPRLAPHRRARSGLAALARTADHLGLADAWHSARDVLALLTDRDLPVPDGSRFWLWGGLDLHADSSATLKAYLSMHGGDVPGWQARESAALTAAGVPAGAPVHDATALLAAAGWCQQVGVGLAADGRWGLKVYYELAGWRPDLVREVLEACRLPDEIGSLTPEVPGVLRASLAARERAGVSLRVDPTTGAVGKLTVTSAFPPPLVGRDELDERVLRWLAGTGVDTAPLTALLAAVAPTWRAAPPLDRRLSLFTRSLSRTRTTTTVYVRPGPAT